EVPDGRRLVLTHEPAVPRDVGGQDGGKSTLERRGLVAHGRVLWHVMTPHSSDVRAARIWASTRNVRQEERMRSYRPYSRAASIIHLTQSGAARGGSSQEVDSTKRERLPAVSMQRFTSASICAFVARSKMVTSTFPIATTLRWLPSVISRSS